MKEAQVSVDVGWLYFNNGSIQSEISSLTQGEKETCITNNDFDIITLTPEIQVKKNKQSRKMELNELKNEYRAT